MITLALIVMATGFDKPIQVTAADGIACTYYKNFVVKVAESDKRVSFVRYGKPAQIPQCSESDDANEVILDMHGVVGGAFDDFLVVENDNRFAVYDTKSATRVLKDTRVGALQIDKAKVRYRRTVRLPCDDLSEKACQQRVQTLTGATIDIKSLCNRPLWQNSSTIAYNVSANRGDFDPQPVGHDVTCSALMPSRIESASAARP